jgi:signal transduction histidine kinase
MFATTRFGPSAVGSLVRFGLLALVPVVALGVVLAHVLNADVQQRYLEAARTSATLITQVGVQPLLNAQQVAGGMSPTEVAQIDDKLQGAAVSQEVRRLKVWNRDGMIVYSDNHTIIGKTFPIDDDLATALAGQSSASLTDGHSAEDAGDNLAGPLVQVYVPLVFSGTTSPSGAFELYLPYAPVQAAIDNESRQLYGFLIAGLAVFYASMFPVVLLADRWRRRLVHEAQETALANLAVLERLNRLKSEFLTRISHQFRTALVGIQGFSEVIRDSDNLDIAEVRAFASDIYKDAERLDQAFNEMVELDRIETGRATLKIARTEINQVIAGAVQAARNQKTEQAIVERLEPSLPAVPCDTEMVSQLLSILLNNAMKYSPAGSEIVVTSSFDAGSVEVSVKDHGPGMPADFDSGLFAGNKGRAGNSANRVDRGVGAGLSLSIARQIVEMHGGRIWFDSSAAHGSVFHFTLPLQVRPSRGLRAVARTA